MHLGGAIASPQPVHVTAGVSASATSLSAATRQRPTQTHLGGPVDQAVEDLGASAEGAIQAAVLLMQTMRPLFFFCGAN
jgi:hypothetical protein